MNDIKKCPYDGEELKYTACCEYFCDEWFECPKCKKKFDIDDLEERK